MKDEIEKLLMRKFLPADFVSDLPKVENIEEDLTRRLHLLLARGGICHPNGDGDDGGDFR